MALLLLMRHAHAVEFAPGCTDAQRPLSERGREQAMRAGEFLEERGIQQVLCSPATRTRETCAGLELEAPVEFVPDLYNAGSDAIRPHIAEQDADLEVILVIAHAPGIPGLAFDLAGPDSDPAAVKLLNRGYPTATVAGIELDSWHADEGRLLFVETF